MTILTISYTSTSSMENALVDTARNLDSFEKILGICAIFKTLPFLHKKLLHLLLKDLVENDANSQLREDENEAELVEQPVDQLLTQLCRLKPGTGPSSSLSALKDAIDDVTSQCSSHNASQAQRMQMQQLLAIAGLHPAFTDIERAKFADAASGFPSLVITSRQDVPSSPTASTSPDGSASPLTPYSLSPQNSLHTDMADAHIGSAHLYAHHSPLHATFSAPSGARIAAPPASLGAKLSLAVTTHEKVQRSLSSSPSAGESENPSFCDSNGSLSNIPADETFVPYVHISPKPGMKDVPLWLKGLRLHKYCSLLAGKTYDELLSVGEVQLEAWNVTKGARHKIAMCIEKLRQRPDDLCKLAKQLVGLSDVRLVLHELRNLLATPIRLAPIFCTEIGKIQNVEDVPPEDLAARIVVVFRKAANLHLSAMAQQSVEDDCSNLFIQMADRCTRHDAFYSALRITVGSVKQSVQASMRSTGFHGHRKVVKSYTSLPTAPFTSLAMYPKDHENEPAHSFFLSVPDAFANRPSPQHRTLHRTQAIGKGGLAAQSPVDLDRLLKPKVGLCRAKSAPVPAKPLSAVESNLWFDGLDPDLESLTLSVTEHALDSFDEHLNF